MYPDLRLQYVMDDVAVGLGKPIEITPPGVAEDRSGAVELLVALAPFSCCTVPEGVGVLLQRASNHERETTGWWNAAEGHLNHSIPVSI